MTLERGILLFGVLAGALGALWFGYAPDWDLLNYHLYNPHALLNGRWAVDVAPAQMQSFLNPLLHLPFYLLFAQVHTAAPVLLAGAIQGSQLLLLYLLLTELVDTRHHRPWVLLVVAALGLGGPVFLNQLGGSQGDTLLSLPVLAALLALLREQKRPDDAMALQSGLLAGLLLGLALALKLTLAIYAIGMGCAALLVLRGAKRWRAVAGMLVGGLLAVGLLGGPWFAFLWAQWENPLFPYFNDWFGSPWIGAESYRDLRFMPRTSSEWLFYPWYWFADSLRVWEFRFRDLRVPLLFTLALLLPAVFSRRVRGAAPGLVLCWVFVVLSYVLWLRLFSIYRYLGVVEMLAPVLIFATVTRVFPAPRVAGAALVVLLASQALVKFDRVEGLWEFRSDAPTALAGLPADAMLVIDGYEPVGYAALWVDDQVPMVRIRANFMASDEPAHALHASALQRVREHGGRRFLLRRTGEQDAALVAGDLARLGLEIDPLAGCRPVFEAESLQRRLALELCPLAQASQQADDTGSGAQRRN